MQFAKAILLATLCLQCLESPGQISPNTHVGPSDGPVPESKNAPVGVAPLEAGGQMPTRNFEIPESGANPAFSYQPSSTHPGITIIQPRDETSDPILVSDSFLAMALKKPTTDQNRLDTIRQYPQMLESTREESYRQMMPQTTTAEGDFEARTLDAGDAKYSMSQDPLAPPFVRVKITDKEGNLIDEYSVSRVSLDKTLQNPEMTGAVLEQSITQNPFRLPEQARANFKNLKEADYWDILDNNPLFGKQEFVKMRKVSREVANSSSTKGAKANLVRPNHPSSKTVKSGELSDRGKAIDNLRRSDSKNTESAHTDKSNPDVQIQEWARLFSKKTAVLSVLLGVGIFAFVGQLRKKNLL